MLDTEYVNFDLPKALRRTLGNRIPIVPASLRELSENESSLYSGIIAFISVRAFLLVIASPHGTAWESAVQEQQFHGDRL